MRQRLSGSALMDGVKFARSIESAYRQLWNEHCQLNPPS
jgi:predicted O-linked N-acetylglucosamine transferase (SPINDLY family)